VHVYAECSCGEEAEFEDADLSGGYESQPCENCGKVVEIHLEVEVAHPRTR
jgi:hypothetical protein